MPDNVIVHMVKSQSPTSTSFQTKGENAKKLLTRPDFTRLENLRSPAVNFEQQISDLLAQAVTLMKIVRIEDRCERTLGHIRINFLC